MKQLKVNIILEILGRPKEHIKEALNNLVIKLGTENGIKIVNKIIHEPTEVKDAKDLYTTFAEVSLELDSISRLFAMLIAYMPAHIEIIEPEIINLTNSQLNELSNNVILRMHDYDAIVKKALIERNFLENKLREVAPYLFKKAEDSKQTEINKKKGIENKRKPKSKAKSKK
jgi:hypothetical protein